MALLLFILCFFLSKPVFAETPIVKITKCSVDTDPEWVELTNTQNDAIELVNWYFKDAKNNQRNIGNTTIPTNEKIKLEYSKGWLNDDGDTIYLYDSANNPIDSFIYTVPTKIPTPTKTPTPTSAPTATPTPDSTITNPASGISLTEFMPYSSIEWVEIYNDNSYPVKLSSWKLTDGSSNNKSLPDLIIPSKGYVTHDFSNLLNNDGDTINLISNSGQAISQRIYENNKYTLDYSWSLVNNSWCQASTTKGYVNVSSCYTAPTNTPTPTPTLISTLTPTPTVDQTKFNPSDIATESAIIEPISEPNYLTPSLTPTTSPTGSVLGDNITNTTQKSYLPLILIISGGILLTSPIVISKLKK